MLTKMLRVGLLFSVLAIVISYGVRSVYAFSFMDSASSFLNTWFAIGGNFGSYFILGIIFSITNMVLSTILLIIYAGTYRKTRAEFNLVLIIVALTLLCYSFVANPLLHVALGYTAGHAEAGLGPFFLLPDVFIFAAVVALLYLRLKY